MALLLKSFESIFSIAIMVYLGYLLTKKAWFDENTSQLFSKLVFSVTLPLYMFNNLLVTLDRDKLKSLHIGLFVVFLSMAISYILAIVVAFFLKIDKNKKGTFISMFFLSNCVFIGIPVNIALFGEKSTPYALLFYIATAVAFWTVGAYGISKDGMSGKVKMFSMENAKRILSPSFIAFLLGITILLFNLYVPKFILDSCKYIGNMTTPLAMFFIGMTIYNVDFSKFKLTKEIIGVLVGRFVVCPLVIFLLCTYLKVPLLMDKVFIIQASMPVMSNTAIVAKNYGADYVYASIVTAITTMLSMFFIPIYYIILSLYNI